VIHQSQPALAALGIQGFCGGPPDPFFRVWSSTAVAIAIALAPLAALRLLFAFGLSCLDCLRTLAGEQSEQAALRRGVAEGIGGLWILGGLLWLDSGGRGPGGRGRRWGGGGGRGREEGNGGAGRSSCR
jgi:hypothetical protein